MPTRLTVVACAASALCAMTARAQVRVEQGALAGERSLDVVV